MSERAAEKAAKEAARAAQAVKDKEREKEKAVKQAALNAEKQKAKNLVTSYTLLPSRKKTFLEQIEKTRILDRPQQIQREAKGIHNKTVAVKAAANQKAANQKAKAAANQKAAKEKKAATLAARTKNSAGSKLPSGPTKTRTRSGKN